MQPALPAYLAVKTSRYIHDSHMSGLILPTGPPVNRD